MYLCYSNFNIIHINNLRFYLTDIFMNKDHSFLFFFSSSILANKASYTRPST